MDAKRIKQLRVYIHMREEAKTKCQQTGLYKALYCVDDYVLRDAFYHVYCAPRYGSAIFTLSEEEHVEYVTMLNAAQHMSALMFREWKSTIGKSLRGVRS